MISIVITNYKELASFMIEDIEVNLLPVPRNELGDTNTENAFQQNMQSWIFLGLIVMTQVGGFTNVKDSLIFTP